MTDEGTDVVVEKMEKIVEQNPSKYFNSDQFANV